MVKKMLALGGIILSSDANCEVGKRIVVCDEERGHFGPWVGHVTVLDEHEQCVWWGFVKNSESVEETRPHLVKLNARCERLGKKSESFMWMIVAL